MNDHALCWRLVGWLVGTNTNEINEINEIDPVLEI